MLLACFRHLTAAGCRFAHRVLPVESICFASVDDIVKAATPLIASAFPASPALKFAVQLELRSCDGLKLDRKSFVDALAALVPAPHTVDLSNPDRVIMVQVIKNAAALAILSDYYALCKYNLRCVFTY
jgi:tRNA acetyltransferase TAN1